MNNLVRTNKGLFRFLLVLFILLILFQSFPASGQLAVKTIAPESAISILVKNVLSGNIVESNNADLLLIPASTAKIVTTISALEQLGSNFQFSTKIFVHGTIQNGTLTGQILIKGDGDPTLGSAYFPSTNAETVLYTIKGALDKAGISRLNGNIIVNTSAIPEPRYPAGRLWEDMANYYGAPPSGLTWRDNTFELDLTSPKATGQLCRIFNMRPSIVGVEFVSYVYSASNQKDSAYIYGYPGLPKWEVRGTIPANRSVFTIKGAMPNPALQFASEIKALLNDNLTDSQVSVFEVTTGEIPAEAVLIHEIRSPYLYEIVNVVNQRSHNLMADHLFLKLNTKVDSPGDSWTNASFSIVQYWQNRGINSLARLRDGSGLSPKNLLSSRYLVDLLIYIDKSENSRIFENSLAVGGKSGTLARMWQKPEWNGRVTAKSGSMEGVMCYAGFIYTRKNQKLAFAIMVNNFLTPPSDIRKAIELEIGRIIDNY